MPKYGGDPWWSEREGPANREMVKRERDRGVDA